MDWDLCLTWSDRSACHGPVREGGRMAVFAPEICFQMPQPPNTIRTTPSAGRNHPPIRISGSDNANESNGI